jgi:hypothetical protein
MGFFSLIVRQQRVTERVGRNLLFLEFLTCGAENQKDMKSLNSLKINIDFG